MKICPVCGCGYKGYPALSRMDNQTEICPSCGVLEALADFLAASDMRQDCSDGTRNVFNGGDDR